LVKAGLLGQTGKYFHLPGKMKLVRERHNRAKSSISKWELAQKYASLLSRVPGIVALYLTGSLAVKNANSDDDLDFMIITSPNQLWLTRLLATAYCEFLGIRRRPKASSVSNQLCLNLYLTTSSLSIPGFKHSLYTAYELIQAVPLYDPMGTQSLLFANNSWLSSYLPNFVKGTVPPRSDLLSKSWLSAKMFSRATARPGQTLLDTLDLLAFKLQLLYMSHKITKEYITRDSAFFHPHSPGQDIIKQCSTPKKQLRRSVKQSTKLTNN
jgi:hypothetical protein